MGCIKRVAVGIVFLALFTIATLSVLYANTISPNAANGGGGGSTPGPTALPTAISFIAAGVCTQTTSTKQTCTPTAAGLQTGDTIIFVSGNTGSLWSASSGPPIGMPLGTGFIMENCQKDTTSIQAIARRYNATADGATPSYVFSPLPASTSALWIQYRGVGPAVFDGCTTASAASTGTYTVGSASDWQMYISLGQSATVTCATGTQRAASTFSGGTLFSVCESDSNAAIGSTTAGAGTYTNGNPSMSLGLIPNTSPLYN